MVNEFDSFEDKDALFTIGIVSKIVDLNPQTLRIYEKRGLIVPTRSRGNTRLYSRDDLKKIKMILTLTRELDVNLAGVEVIMNLIERISSLEHEFGDTMKKIIKKMFEDFDVFDNADTEALVPLSSHSLGLRIRKENER
jgi:MerR family transcriptional regulator, heat shock protein HspR